MTKRNVPLEFSDMLDAGNGPEVGEDGPEVSFDPLAKFFDAAALAGVAGGFAHVEKLQRETAGIDARITSIYQKIAKDAAAKTQTNSDRLTKGAPLQLFMRLQKIDEEQRLVYGVATSEVPDRDDEILDYEASKPYFQAWSDSVHKDSGGASRGNVREMHQNIACGKLEQIAFDDRKKEISVCAKITDDAAWKKVLSRTYTGFSVGGRYVSTTPTSGGLTRFVANPSEISLVDRPACPTSTFQLVKADDANERDRAALVPLASGISKVAPEMPNLRAVPRYGQREVSKADVPEEFQKLVSVDDEAE
jgi:hypothetical protein